MPTRVYAYLSYLAVSVQSSGWSQTQPLQLSLETCRQGTLQKAHLKQNRQVGKSHLGLLRQSVGITRLVNGITGLVSWDYKVSQWDYRVSQWDYRVSQLGLLG